MIRNPHLNDHHPHHPHPHQGVQAGEVMEVFERHPDDHDEHGGRTLQPNLRPLHHHLHLRCDGHAALWQRLRQVRMNQTATMRLLMKSICWSNVGSADNLRKKWTFSQQFGN